jgi:hypothetical protein
MDGELGVAPLPSTEHHELRARLPYGVAPSPASPTRHMPLSLINALMPLKRPIPATAVLQGLFLSFPSQELHFLDNGEHTLQLEIRTVPHSLPALEALLGGPVVAFRLQTGELDVVAICRKLPPASPSYPPYENFPEEVWRTARLFPLPHPAPALLKNVLFLRHNLHHRLRETFALDSLFSLPPSSLEPLYNLMAPERDTAWQSAAFLQLHLERSPARTWELR